MDPKDPKKPQQAQRATGEQGATSAKPASATVRPTVRVRVRKGATLIVAEGGKPVRKTEGEWVDLDERDLNVPAVRRNVETEKDIEEAARPAKARAEQQAATQALFNRYVEADIKAAEREKAVRGPLLEVLTPQGTAPEPARIG